VAVDRTTWLAMVGAAGADIEIPQPLAD
jgi:hypothetical protein